jgi:hypothetical protein
MDVGNNQEITIESVRQELADVIAHIQALEGANQPPAVQELVLARRSTEDSRMRLGVAQAYVNGHNPWASKVETKQESN